VASGSRVRLLEDFMGAPAYNREALNAQLIQEVWVAAMYHTIVDSLEGIAWLFVIVGLILLAALFIINKTKPELLRMQSERTERKKKERGLHRGGREPTGPISSAARLGRSLAVT
jgi:hypothetical protein